MSAFISSSIFDNQALVRHVLLIVKEESIQELWDKSLQLNKKHSLPLARIKKIMKLDQETKVTLLIKAREW
jgi:hypothetical protein